VKRQAAIVASRQAKIGWAAFVFVALSVGVSVGWFSSPVSAVSTPHDRMPGTHAVSSSPSPFSSSTTTSTTSHIGQSGSGPFYLALGDSVPVWDGDASYPNLLLDHYQTALPDLQLVNLAVSGETTTSMIEDGQYTSALAFLHAHENEVALITIDIGGNDVVGCASSSGLNEQCFQQAEAVMATNITTMLGGLHEAAPGVPVFGMTYYDPFLGDWLAGGVARTTALETIPGAVSLNETLTSLYGSNRTADVQDAFAVTNSTTMVSSSWGTVPIDVKDACQWLDIECAVGQLEGFGDDPNAAGQVQIAQAFENIIGAPGYWEVGRDGGVFNFGITPFVGSLGGRQLNAPVVGMASALGGQGYWLVASDGGVFSFGEASFFGSMGRQHLNAPVVGMAASSDGQGYWLAAADGGVFSFGDAQFYGSADSQHLNAPIVGIAATPDGKGYWLVAADGGVFSFGDAQFFGSMGGKHLNQPIAGTATTQNGQGYWLVASDGGVFSFGDASFGGSMGGKPLLAHMVGIVANPNGTGYWTVAADGGVFSFGGAPYEGSMAGQPLGGPIVGIVTTPRSAPS
jgi:lysophospholipase L1-like esterase